MSANVVTFPFARAAQNATAHSENLAMLLRYVALAQQGKLKSIAIISTSDRWRHGLEMMVEDDDASDVVATLEIAKHRCIRKLEGDGQ
jgi:hypothetical protein